MTDYFDTQDPGELKDRSVSGTGYQFVGKLVSAVVGVVATAVLARALDPEAFGLTAMAFAIVGLVGIFSNLSLKTAIVQRKELRREQVSSVFWLNSMFAVLLTGICIGLAPVGAWFYEDGRIFGIIAVSAIQFILSALHVPHLALLERNLLFRKVTISNVLGVVIAQGAAIGMAWDGFGYWSLVVGPLVGQAFTTIYLWMACSWRPGGLTIDDHVKSMLAFGANLSLSSLASFLNRNTDDFLLGRWAGASALGLYNRAYKIFTYPMNFLFQPMSSVAIPILSRIQDKPDTYRSTYLRILSLLLAGTAAAGALLVGASDFIVAILLGPKWAEAAPILAVLGVGVIFQPLGKTSSWIFVSQNRTDEAMKFALFISTPVTVSSFVIGLPWGVMGVAIAYITFATLVRLPASIWMTHRRGPTSARRVLRQAAPFLLNACISLGLLLALRRFVHFDSAVVGLAVCGLATALTYGAGIIAFEKTRETAIDGYELIRDHLTGE